MFRDVQGLGCKPVKDSPADLCWKLCSLLGDEATPEVGRTEHTQALSPQP